MIKITAANKYGQSIDLTASKSYAIAQVTGLTPPVATINTTPLATKDGSVYNSARAENRNIVLYIYPRNRIEAARINLYTYFKAKQPIRLYIETGSRSVWIDGFVESIEGDLYENPQAIQISIICTDPFFKNKTEIKADFISGAATISNPSDEESGAIFELTASGAVTAPSITNTTTGETYALATAMQNGDKITLNTRRGEKSVTLTRNGTTTNIINDMTAGSRWVSIIPGANELETGATTGAGNLSASVTLQPIFEGI